MSEHDGKGEVIGRRSLPETVLRLGEMACPEQDVEDDVARQGVGLESPERHLLEQLEHERVEAPAPVEPEQEEERLGLDGAAEALEVAEKGRGGAEPGGEAGSRGEEAVEGGGRVEVAGAAGAPEEEGERDGV